MALGWPARKADEKAAGFCGALESTAGEPKDPRESQFPSETRSLFSAEKPPLNPQQQKTRDGGGTLLGNSQEGRRFGSMNYYWPKSCQ